MPLALFRRQPPAASLALGLLLAVGGCGGEPAAGVDDAPDGAAGVPGDAGAALPDAGEWPVDPGPACGDETCGAAETCSNCPSDCGLCPSCPDGVCGPGENCNNCSSDCADDTCCTPAAELRGLPPPQLLEPSTCQRVIPCAGSRQGLWHLASACLPAGKLFERVEEVCASAIVTPSSPSVSGECRIDAGVFARRIDLSVDAVAVLPSTCASAPCLLEEARLQGLGFRSAVCLPQEPDGCRCQLTAAIHVDRSSPFTDDASGLVLAERTVPACAASGRLSFEELLPGDQPLVLEWAAPPFSPEICDGFDNDRDGQVDEDARDCPSDCLGLGACQGAATAACVSGTWVCSYTAPQYQLEENLCDGLDNDCDGRTDENALDAPATNQQGVCAGTRKRCVGGALVEPDLTLIPAYEPVETRCDHVDNDCDGQKDENLEEPESVFLGVCSGVRRVCQQGLWEVPDVTSLPGYEHPEASCDKLDNDCDGWIDEMITGTVDAAIQVGVCAGAKKTCQLGEWVEPVYRYRTGFESPEASCDGLDNDCDGQTDEELTAPPAANQNGVCLGATKRCTGVAGWRDDLGSIAGHEWNEVTCDGLDNDCNGEVDEELYSSVLASRQSGVCAGSRLICSAGSWTDPDFAALPYYEGVEITCDGRDNDCDGEVDESLVAPLATRQAGVCAGSLQTCRGALGWQDPDLSTVPGGMTVESGCNGLDDNCDGRADETSDVDGDGAYRAQASGCLETWGVQGRVDCDDADATRAAVCRFYVNAAAAPGGDGSTWASAFDTLEEALAVAPPGYEVWVAKGTYRAQASGSAPLFAPRAGIALYGGFAGTEEALSQRQLGADLSAASVLSGDVNGDDGPAFANRADNVATLLSVSGAAPTRIDGFAFEGAQGGSALLAPGGTLSLANCVFRGNHASASGAAVAAGTVEITDSVFIGNRAATSGGAVAADAPTLTRCSFNGNQSATGAAVASAGKVVATDCSFAGNQASADGGALNAGTAELLRCSFEANLAASGGALVLKGTSRVELGRFVANQATEGGAVFVGAGAAATFWNSEFRGNAATQGGGALNGASAARLELAGCLFNANTAGTDGGAVLLRSATTGTGELRVVNGTFAHNRATGRGGAIRSETATATRLVNSVLWGNAPTQVSVASGPSLVVTSTCIDDNTAGATNLKLAGADPFADSDGPDAQPGTADDVLRLAAASACRDSGDNTALPAGMATDVASGPRIVNAVVDRGAYEN